MGEAVGTSRRGVLGRALVLVAGAFGLGAVERAEASGSVAAPTTKGTELRFYGRNFHLHAPDRRAGQVPEKGERHSTYGELLARPKGKVVGSFAAAHLTHDSPFAAGATSLEIHTFTLKDGTIHGLGSVARGAEGQFVILGGTGRYAGAQGSYTARQSSRELGGNGTAEFHLTLAE
jgi:Allene oxide cyclase barrel like domain